MRNLVSLFAVVLLGCGSSSSHADTKKDEKKAANTAAGAKQSANSPKSGNTGNTQKRVAEAKPKTELPKKPMIPPTGKRLLKKVTLKKLQRNRWFKFADQYYRLWGGRMIGSHPKGVSVTHDGKVFVTNVGFTKRNNVDRFDIPKLKIMYRARFRGGAIESVPSPDGKILYASNFHRKVVTALYTKNLKVKREYKVGTMPKHFAVTKDGRRLYVSNWESNDMHVVDTKTGKTLHHLKLGKNPRGTVLLNDEKKLYVTNFGSRNVMVIDVKTMKVIKTIAQGCKAARHAAVTDDDSMVLVTCYGTRHLLVIDPKTDKVVRKVVVGNGPKTLAISKDQRFVYTADYRGSSMTFVDLKTWKTRVIPLPTWKTSGIAVSPDDKWIYLTGWDSRNLIVMERLMPGEDPKKLKRGPRQPRKKCHRKKLTYCRDRYP